MGFGTLLLFISSSSSSSPAGWLAAGSLACEEEGRPGAELPGCSDFDQSRNPGQLPEPRAVCLCAYSAGQYKVACEEDGKSVAELHMPYCSALLVLTSTLVQA